MYLHHKNGLIKLYIVVYSIKTYISKNYDIKINVLLNLVIYKFLKYITITNSIVNGILDASKTVETKIINASNDVKDNIVNSLTNFGNKLKNDLIETGGLLKDQLAPIGDGLKSMFSDLFNGFLTSFQAKQQQQDNLLLYLPIGLIGVSILYIVNKK